MRIALTIFFFLLFVFIIHMAVFMATGKTVADNLGFIGVMVHAFGSIYLARLAARKITDPKTLPSGQPVSLAQARADAIDAAVERGDLKEEDLQAMLEKLQGKK